MRIKTTTTVSKEDYTAMSEMAEAICEIAGIPYKDPSEFPTEATREIEIDPQLFSKIAGLLRLAKPFLQLLKGYKPILKELVKIKEEIKTSSL